MSGEISVLCNTIEESYEFMLAYAGQGLAGEQGSQIRHHLERAAQALSVLADCYLLAVNEKNLQPAGRYRAFGAVLSTDAHKALLAIELVLAQISISSQMIDNLNASIHLRSLLTDLFLVDEILKAQHVLSRPASSGP
jgi:hypothetical protein